MTDVRTAARAKVKQEDIAGVEERIAQAAEQMADDVRRARAREAAAKQRVALLAAHEQTKQSILQTTGGIMIAVRTVVDGLRKLVALYATLRKQATELNKNVPEDLKEEIPADWSPFEIAVRFGFRIGAEFSKISGMAMKFGAVAWKLHGNHVAGDDWVKRERKILGMRDEQ